MAIDIQAVGRTGPAVDIAWEADDCLLYAVSVGVGLADPARGRAMTTENSHATNQAVLPTFGAVLSQRAPLPHLGSIDWSQVVHAEQSLDLFGPLLPTGAMRACTTVASIEDKRSGALVHLRTLCVDPDTDDVVLNADSAIFIRGEGGFGGAPRDPTLAWTPPDRRPDHEVACPTRPDQALLYRLTGDRNPLHSDPIFAARAGFDRPILHGMCTYGVAAASLVEAVTPQEPAALRSIAGRFTAPTWPGDTLVTEIWVDGSDVWFRVHSGESVVLDRGRARIKA